MKEWIVFPGMRDCFMRYVLMAVNYLAENKSVKNTPIIIMGDSGVGKSVFIDVAKEIFAKANSSSISKLEDNHKIKRLNCASFSRELADSEIFGHVKGAYTGAVGDKAGIVEVMDGGLLILDEIGELSKEVQAKLLIFIEDGEYRRLGSHKVKKAKVKVIGTTNINHGDFRNDFWFRFYPVFIPALHERRLDVLYYVATKYPDIFKRLTPQHALSLLSYNWIGNFREVDRVVHLIMAEDEYNAIKAGEVVSNRGELFFPIDQRQTPLAKIYLNDFCKMLIDKKFNIELLNSIISTYGLQIPYSFSTRDELVALREAICKRQPSNLKNEKSGSNISYFYTKFGDEITWEFSKRFPVDNDDSNDVITSSFGAKVDQGFSMSEFLNDLKYFSVGVSSFYKEFDRVNLVKNLFLNNLDSVRFVENHSLIERVGACFSALCKLFLRNIKSSENVFSDSEPYLGHYWFEGKAENYIMRTLEKNNLFQPVWSIVANGQVIVDEKYDGIESWGEYVQKILNIEKKDISGEIDGVESSSNFQEDIFEGTEKEVLTSYYRYLLSKYRKDKSVFKHAGVNDSTCRHRLEKLGLLPRK